MRRVVEKNKNNPKNTGKMKAYTQYRNFLELVYAMELNGTLTQQEYIHRPCKLNDVIALLGINKERLLAKMRAYEHLKMEYGEKK